MLISVDLLKRIIIGNIKWSSHSLAGPFHIRHLLLITLASALSYESVPVSDGRVTASQHEQYRNQETEAAEWNLWIAPVPDGISHIPLCQLTWHAVSVPCSAKC